MTSVRAIAAGDTNALALREDGTLVAWGDNGLAQAAVPAGLANVVDVAGGNGYSLALRSDGHSRGVGSE